MRDSGRSRGGDKEHRQIKIRYTRCRSVRAISEICFVSRTLHGNALYRAHGDGRRVPEQITQLKTTRAYARVCARARISRANSGGGGGGGGRGEGERQLPLTREARRYLTATDTARRRSSKSSSFGNARARSVAAASANWSAAGRTIIAQLSGAPEIKGARHSGARLCRANGKGEGGGSTRETGRQKERECANTCASRCGLLMAKLFLNISALIFACGTHM